MKRVFVKKEAETKIVLDKLDEMLYGNKCFNVVQESASGTSSLRLNDVEADNFVQTLYDSGFVEMLNE